jgi:hypothetical protein
MVDMGRDERGLDPRRRPRNVAKSSGLSLAFSALLGASLAFPVDGAAHPGSEEVSGTASTSQLLERSRSSFPLRSLDADVVEDDRSVLHPFSLDIAGLAVSAGAGVLTFGIDLHEPVAPDPGALLLHFARPGDVVPRWSVFQDDGGAWGLYRIAAGGWGHERVADAAVRQQAAHLDITLSARALPGGELVVYVHTAGYDDQFTPTFDVAPNDRLGLRVPSPDQATWRGPAPSIGQPGLFAGPL